MSWNFPLLLVLAVAICGALALIDLLVLAPRRRRAIQTYGQQVSEPDPAVLEQLINRGNVGKPVILVGR